MQEFVREFACKLLLDILHAAGVRRMTESALPARLKLHAMSARTLGVFQGGALGEAREGHGVNRQGALSGSFLGYFFQYVFRRPKK